MPKRRAWTTADVKVLRSLAGRKTPEAIARALRRTVAAVRFNAFSKRIRLAVK
jgi:hypothetical protein